MFSFQETTHVAHITLTDNPWDVVCVSVMEIRLIREKDLNEDSLRCYTFVFDKPQELAIALAKWLAGFDVLVFAWFKTVLTPKRCSHRKKYHKVDDVFQRKSIAVEQCSEGRRLSWRGWRERNKIVFQVHDKPHNNLSMVKAEAATTTATNRTRVGSHQSSVLIGMIIDHWNGLLCHQASTWWTTIKPHLAQTQPLQVCIDCIDQHKHRHD